MATFKQKIVGIYKQIQSHQTQVWQSRATKPFHLLQKPLLPTASVSTQNVKKPIQYSNQEKEFANKKKKKGNESEGI